MQALIAYSIVAAAAGYAAWLLMPHALRRRIVAGLIRLAPAQSGLLRRLESNAQFGGCSSCKGCEAGTRPAPGTSTRGRVSQRNAESACSLDESDRARRPQPIAPSIAMAGQKPSESAQAGNIVSHS